MSAAISHISPGCLLLCNEPFASTNEREGSDIGRQVFLPLARRESRSPWLPTLSTWRKAFMKSVSAMAFSCAHPGKPGATIQARRRGAGTNCLR